jgi:hypothetical protein
MMHALGLSPEADIVILAERRASERRGEGKIAA